MPKLDVMTAIHDGHITMKPKWYFVVGSLLVGLGLAGAILTTTLLALSITFHLRTQAPWGFLRYGAPGGPIFFRLLPWRAILIAGGSLAAGLWLLKKYDISYKKSFTLISLSTILFLGTTVLAADRAGLNDRLRERLPLMPLYSQNFVQPDIIIGEVIDATDSAIIIQDPQTHENIEVSWDEQTKLPGGSDFAIGDRVGAIGEFENGVFRAKGMHEGRMRWEEKIEPLERRGIFHRGRDRDDDRRFRDDR